MDVNTIIKEQSIQLFGKIIKNLFFARKIKVFQNIQQHGEQTRK